MKIRCLSAIVTAALLICLCGCKGSINTPSSDKSGSADTESVPEQCRTYYNYKELNFIAPKDSNLPIASDAHRGSPDYLGVWYRGEYGDIKSSGSENGYTFAELTEKKAIEAGDYGRFQWNGERYHCIHVTAEDSFIPNICSSSGGILWLELEGDCFADDGTAEGAHFVGFDTVVITGSGKLIMKQGIDCGVGARPFPSLIIDGAEIECPSVTLTKNTDSDDTANLILLGGSLECDTLIANGDICTTDGELDIDTLVNGVRLVCRGGKTEISDGWGFAEDFDGKTVSTVILSGGELEIDAFVDESTDFKLWKGKIIGKGLSNMKGLEILGSGVTVTDTLK